MFSGDVMDEDHFYEANTVVYRTKRGLLKVSKEVSRITNIVNPDRIVEI